MKKDFGAYPVEVAMDFVEKWEGFRAMPYTCPAGVETAGFGHTGDFRGYSFPLTFHEAEELLRKDLEYVRDGLVPFVDVQVTERQFIALLSLAYNIGVTGVVKGCPRLMAALNAGNFNAAAEEFLDVTRAGGKALPGLAKRRAAEAALMREA